MLTADIPGGSILSSTDERLRLGCDCLMAQLPFWLSGQTQVVNKLVAALEHLNVSQITVAHGWCVLPSDMKVTNSVVQSV